MASEPLIIGASGGHSSGSNVHIERSPSNVSVVGLSIPGSKSPAPSASTLSLGTETPASSATPEEVPTPPPGILNADGKGNSSEKEKEEDLRKRRGWPNRYPFRCYNPWQNSQKEGETEKIIYWEELTLQAKLDYRKAFLKEYLSETKKCLPHVRKLFIMIYRLSPWRATTILAFNIVNGLLPALTLQTRGNFLMIVSALEEEIDHSYKLDLKTARWTKEA